MKRFLFAFLFILLLITMSWLAGSALPGNSKTFSPFTEKKFSSNADIKEKLEEKVQQARSFVKLKGFNNETCFLIDMSLASGQNRFFIYDLKKDTIRSAALVAHGNCFQSWLEGRQYSNVVGSGCTSLGKYRVGYPYTGKFGYSYKLYGLDSSNNNAFERTVVLHAHSCIPENETMDEICQSNGCPTVTPIFYEQLKKIINTSKKPVLLWIYD